MPLLSARTFASLYREHGLRWSAFRVAYAFRLRTGLIRLHMRQYRWSDRPLETWLKNPAQRIARRAAGISKPKAPPNPPWNPHTAIEEGDRILSGDLRYFAHDFRRTGFPPNWHTVPSALPTPAPGPDGSTKHAAEDRRSSRIADQHWSHIAHDSDVDIKLIWEPSRFAFVYTLVRAYAASDDDKYAEAFWQSILDWAEHNPPNTGPNWMDGQEIALRLMAWTFGFHQFANSPSTTPLRTAQLTHFVAAQAERIYKNIGYAISTRSNHTISEAFGLWLVGLLFPELKQSDKYLSLGRELLEQEAAAQIFPDGSYSMYSVNYHRFILHVYLYAIRLGELNNSPFSPSLYSSISASIEYLSHLIDPHTGQMPVYGSNDGALVLPLNNCDFIDYRPLLQLGWYVTKHEWLFDPGEGDEDILWLCSPLAFQATRARARVRPRQTSFPHGGTYLLHGADSKAVIRCTTFRGRPSHADQLHVDLWMHGHNIACDAGTYLYSGDRRWRNALARTSAHNTVTVDGKDQMTMVSRFTWTNWSKGNVLRHSENLWQGEHDGYKPVSHQRTVMMLDGCRWLVVDRLAGKQSHRYTLQWLLSDTAFEQKDHAVLLSVAEMKYKVQVGLAEGNGDFSLVREDPNSTRGWRSRYYGHKEPAISVALEATQPRVMFWSFFGFENDAVGVQGNVIQLNSRIIPLVA